MQLNGADINTAGTLTNVAYLNQANTFSNTNRFSSRVGIGVNPSFILDVLTSPLSANDSTVAIRSGVGTASYIGLRPFANDYGASLTYNISFDGSNNNRVNPSYSGFAISSNLSATPPILQFDYVAAGANPAAMSTGMVLTDAGKIGIGDTTPASLFTVGAGDLFQVNSSGAIVAATGITSSGAITFSGLTADRLVTTTTGGQLTTSISSSNVAASITDETGSGAAVFGTSPTLSGVTINSGATINGGLTLGTALTVANGGTGATTLNDLITLGTHTTGNYVATISAGNGISGSSSTEGGTPTIALGNLSSNWTQGGAFDIVLNNAASELQILESAGATYYGTLDVGDLSADATYTLSGASGTILTTANYSGTLGSVFLQAANNLSDLANAATARTNLGLGNVENTALSTWTGSTNITTLGTITTGAWNGTSLTDAYVSDTLTSSIFIGSGSATNAIDLATAEVAGILGATNGGTGVNNGSNTITLGGNINTASSFTTSGANALTLTTTASTNVTLPTSGTLYGTATGSITSAQLLGSLSDETGTGVAVFGTNPTFSASATFSGLSINSAVYTNGSSALTTTAPTSGTIGYWSRSGTTLQPATANDVISVSGNTGDIVTVTSSATGSANKALTVSQTGATSGTDYAGYFSNTGAATTNVGLYATATGATNNYAAIFDQGNVGIGSNNPSTRLHVITDDATTNATTDILTLAHTTTSTAANNIGAGILFQGEDTIGQTEDAGRISGVLTNAAHGSETGSLLFATRLSGTALSTKMTLDGNGALGINTTPSSAQLEISNTSGIGAGTVSGIKVTSTSSLGGNSFYGLYVDRNTGSGQNAYGLYSTTSGATTNLGAYLQATNSTTNTVTDMLKLVSLTSGTAANNIGTGILLQSQDTGAAIEDAGRVSAILTNATHGAETSALLFSTRTSGGVLTERMRISGDGSVGIGTTASASGLDVTNASGTIPSAGVLRVVAAGNSGSGAIFQINGVGNNNQFMNIDFNGTSIFNIGVQGAQITAPGRLVLTGGSAVGVNDPDNANVHRMEGTLNTGNAYDTYGLRVKPTGVTNNNAVNQGAIRAVIGSSAVSSSSTASSHALFADASAAFTSGDGLGTVGNFGVYALNTGTVAGDRYGLSGVVSGGDRNIGVVGRSVTAKNSATNIGVLGYALNTGTSPIQIGGYFGLQSALPTFASAALMADNGSTTSDIFVARDNGTSTFVIADGGNVDITSADLGNGSAGRIFTLGRNNNGTATGAGSINFQSKAGTAGYVWQDNAGNLRINTAAPSNANDTAGTVVGTQTSTRETKQDIQDYTDYTAALMMVTNAPLHTFRYIKDVQGYGDNSALAKQRIGFIADEVATDFMWGNAIDQVSINGILMASVKALNSKITDLQSQVTALQGAQTQGGIQVSGSTPLVLANHLYLSHDSVGEAKILPGDTKVRISFDKPYQYQPIVTATPNSRVGSEYWIDEKDSSGFTIFIDQESNDVIYFNWHAFASEGAKLTVSDGTTEDIILAVPQPAVAGDSTADPSASNAPTGDGSQSPAVEPPNSGADNSQTTEQSTSPADPPVSDAGTSPTTN